MTNARIELIGDVPHFVATREMCEGRTYDLYQRVPSELVGGLDPARLSQATRVVHCKPQNVSVTARGPIQPPTEPAPATTGGESKMQQFMDVVPYHIPAEKREEYLATQRRQREQAGAAKSQQPRKVIVNAAEGTCRVEGSDQEYALVRPYHDS